MKEETVDALDTVLTLEKGSTSFRRDDIPDALIDTEFVAEEFRPPTRCPVREWCDAYCDSEIQDDEVFVQCDDDHEGLLSIEEHRFYSLQLEKILEVFAESIDRSLASFDESHLPRYISGELDDSTNLYLIVSPAEYEATVNKICMETLQEESPALLITPEKSIKDLLEIQALFSSGNLIYSVPLTEVSNSEEIQGSLERMDAIQEMEQQILREQGGEHSVVYRVNSNPRYILTELNHMRLLRLAKELPQHSGTRLEKVAESAFSHLFVTYPESGGEDDRGSNLPDILFYVSESVLPDGYEPILGVVDAKSGKDAKFGSEPVEGKHTEYLKRARRQSVSPDQIAHTFVVLDFDGQQEIDFYDEMSEKYTENEYMIVVTAEALSLIMAAYLSHTVSNELELVKGNFQSMIYPFFHQDSFIEAGLSEITRSVGQNPDEYKRRYQERPGLMIITQEVVEERIQEFVESPNDVQRILESYFHQMPTV
jgi:hypothetical protein